MTTMTASQIKLIATDEQLRKRLAKLMAQQCFRNTELENLHADGKISQEEMKALMIDVVNKTYTCLTRLLCSSKITALTIQFLQQQDVLSYWNDPVFEKTSRGQ